MIVSLCCFWKCDRNSGCRIVITCSCLSEYRGKLLYASLQSPSGADEVGEESQQLAGTIHSEGDSTT
jgi:hypothetical protein